MPDTPGLPPDHAVAAASLRLDTAALPPHKCLCGPARVGTAVLGEWGGRTIGVWEIEPSVSTDVETDEWFVVLHGRATVHFADGTPPLALGPGHVGRLSAGAATTWHVTETLRKIYFA